MKGVERCRLSEEDAGACARQAAARRAAGSGAQRHGRVEEWCSARAVLRA